ncbi:MAG: 6-carboxytetrahydropterin synthase [FCB group bacterium]|jgi:6-pyruvoyltetrahydropterin/6-carboxytetrahydropterin synthase
MTIKIGKEFRWEMSHRLPANPGDCKNIHGHSYKVWVEITGNTDSDGVVLDYYELEKIINPMINKLDHSFICDAKDTLMLEFLEKNNFKLFVLDDYTTAENIAQFLLNELSSVFRSYSNINCLLIKLFETENTFAEVKSSLSK